MSLYDYSPESLDRLHEMVEDMMTYPRITIYCDGGCCNNGATVEQKASKEVNAVGAYCAIVVWPDGKEDMISGHMEHTTNNAMELRAVRAGIRHVYPPKLPVHIVMDSAYVHDGLSKWLPGWVKKGWKTSTGEPLKNMEIWKELWEYKQNMTLSFERVNGHSGHLYNERCDSECSRLIAENR